MFIRSERLFLRPGWPEDWEELLARIADEAAIAANGPAEPWPGQSEPVRAFATAPQERLLPHFLVTLPGAEGARLLGCAGLSRGPAGDAELGFWIARPHWGQGYATEAARAVLGLARALGHRRVLAHHRAESHASARVLAKVGFRRLGGDRSGAGRAVSHAIDLAGPDNCGGDDGMRGWRRAA